MKNYIFNFTMLLMLFCLVAACSKEKEVLSSAGNEKIDLLAKGVFTFSAESFGEDQNKTRTASTLPKPKMVELGDGMMAELSLEEDKVETKESTRATLLREGHYGIYAVDRNTGLRVGNVLKGTVKYEAYLGVNKFVPNAGSILRLPPGSYSFICYNENVTDDGENLTIVQEKDALIGKTDVTISGNEYKVHFDLKHQTARVRLAFVTLMNGGEYAARLKDVKIALTAIGNIPQKHIYAVNPDNFTPELGTDLTLKYNTLLEWLYPYPKYKGLNTEGKFTEYLYWLPNTNPANIKLSFTSGTCYRKSLIGASLTLAPIGSLPRNRSYTLRVTLFPKFTYLFSNGTTGYLKDKGTRTPIGVVIREKTASTKGLAAALNSVGEKNMDIVVYSSLTGNKTWMSNLKDAIKDMDGYKWTWDPTTSKDNQVKATSNNYPAFKAAASYNPGVPTSGIGKWFLPSLGQIALLNYVTAFAQTTVGNNENSTLMRPYASLAFYYAFSNAGGNGIKYVNLTGGPDITSSTFGAPLETYYYWSNSSNGFYDSNRTLRQLLGATILPFVEF